MQQRAEPRRRHEHALELLEREGMLVAVARAEAPEEVGYFEGGACLAGRAGMDGHRGGGLW